VTIVRIEKLRVFLLISSWASSATVELFQLRWTSAELSFFSCSWAFQLSWASSAAVELFQLQLNFNFNCVFNCSWTSTGVQASSTRLQRGSTGVQGKFNRGPKRFNRGPGKVQHGSREVQPGSTESSTGVFPRTSLVKTGWTGPRGGSTDVRVTWPVWPPD
jgi:hypothetical protein